MIDSHLHLWDPAKINYPWLGNVPPLNQAFLPKNVPSPKNNVGFVFLECDAHPNDYLKEVQWVSNLENEGFPIKAIVAGYPAEKGKENLAYLNALKNFPLVKGVRRQYAESPDFCLQDKFIEGVQLLADFNLTFDLCFNYTQFQESIKLVEKCPNNRFILDHLGKPAIKYGLILDWKNHLKQLKEAGVHFIKLSGLMTESWLTDYETFKPYLEFALEVFGFDGIMFGSDWPVVNLNGSYQTWYDHLVKFTQNWSEENQNKFWFENAKTAYNLT